MRGNPRNMVRDDLMSRGWTVIESAAVPTAVIAMRNGEEIVVHINRPGRLTAAVTDDGISYNFAPGPVLAKRSPKETA